MFIMKPDFANVIISRDGLYTSFLFPVTIFFISGFLTLINFQVSIVQLWALILTISTLQFLQFRQGSLRSNFFEENLRGLLIVIMFLAILIYHLRAVQVRFFLLALIPILTVTQSNWRFDGDSTIYRTHKEISSQTNSLDQFLHRLETYRVCKHCK